MFTPAQLKQIILVASVTDFNNPSIQPALHQLNEEIFMPAPPMYITIA